MRRPNILLVVLDSVRAKNCSLYGHDNNTTPFLKEFSDQAVVFEQARSPSIHSVSSHASMFSGFHVEEHGITNHEDYLEIESNIWHELENSFGYNTGIFTPNVVVTEASNLAEPFGRYVGPKRRTAKKIIKNGLTPGEFEGNIEPFEYLVRALKHPRPFGSIINGIYHKFSSSRAHDPRREQASVYIEEFLSWIENQDAPWGGFINLMDAHYPYIPEPEYDLWGGDQLARVRDQLPDGPLAEHFLKGHPWGQLKALEPIYDGCIRQIDESIKYLVSELKSLGEFSNTLIIFTSDHGEGFGERSKLTPSVRLVDHNWGIHESLLHVPLIVKEPWQSKKCSISEPVSLTNLPKAIRAAVRGKEIMSNFSPQDGKVISSTYRVIPPGSELPIADKKRKQYLGPWRAVYKNDNGCVLKYSSHNETQIISKIVDAQTSYVLKSKSGDITVDDIFGAMADKGVKTGGKNNSELDTDVENRLNDLGYMR